MSNRGKRAGSLVRGLVLVALGVTVVAPENAGAGDPPEQVSFNQVRLDDGDAANAVRAALARAARRLRLPACRGILSEFQDATGRPLEGVLDEGGRTYAAHVAGLFFYDGSQSPQCKQPTTLAYTSPGSRVVLVCPIQFRSQERQDRRWVDVIVIHETLHTLGLGENPPTSQYISARIFSRCVAHMGGFP